MSEEGFAYAGEAPADETYVSAARADDAYQAARQAVGALSLAEFRGKRILLKPNAGRIAAPHAGVTTNPAVVAAAIDAFADAGAAEVAVGESPITGVKAMEAFEATGIAAVAHERGCRLIDMDARPAIDVEVPAGEAIRALRVCADVFDYDAVVSIPVMKTHMHTGVTLSVKNMKGCLWRRSKVDLHMLPPVAGANIRSLDIAIADMAGVLRPHLAIADGSIGMEGLGPSAGHPKALNVVVAGTDAIAVDAVCCRLMGRTPADVPHLRICAERGYGTIDPNRIRVAPPEWTSWAKPFAAAPANLSIAFPDVEILDRQSCSACQSTLLLFLKRHGAELREYFPEGEKIRIAIGKGHDSVPDGTLCIGNCTACHRLSGIFVAGCPPVGSAILRKLQGES